MDKKERAIFLEDLVIKLYPLILQAHPTWDSYDIMGETYTHAKTIVNKIEQIRE